MVLPEMDGRGTLRSGGVMEVFVRKAKIIRPRIRRTEPNAATKRALREAQLPEGLETFETVADWAKTVRKIARSSVARTQRKK
jgi:hypothetical protein